MPHTIQSVVPLAVDPLASPNGVSPLERSPGFVGNMSRPIHRWFRYSAGFSAAWVEHVLATGPTNARVLDPFAGSGTTLCAASMSGVESVGLETHPFVCRVAEAKLRWDVNPVELQERGSIVLEQAVSDSWRDPPPLLAKIYPPTVLAELRGLRQALDQVALGDAIDDLLWLALVAILRVCSPAGTAQWQYVLPNKRKRRVAEPRAAFAAHLDLMAADILAAPPPSAPASILAEDAREARSIPDSWATLVITSPPYPNNFDYADATRIEMTFLEEVAAWGDLQGAVRDRLIRACSQHMGGYEPAAALAAEELAPIMDELYPAYQELEALRLQRGGRKAYHSMVLAYFHDIARVLQALRRVCASGARVLVVIGDSAPYGVHIPAERWIGELALGAGFDRYAFTKLRDRNTKWKNRKHQVPLHEGLLVVEG